MQLTLSQPIVDAKLDESNGDYHLTYEYQGEPRSHPFTDVELMKLLRRHGFIESHQTVAGEIYVMTETEKMPLWIFATEVNLNKLIEIIEK